MQGNFSMPFATCDARTRGGTACRAPAMINGRCRLHGGLSDGAPTGNRNAFKHGRYSAEAIALRRRARALVKQMRLTIAAVK